MSKLEKLEELANKIVAENDRKVKIKKEYAEKEKVKKLTTDERLTRIEKLLGID